MHHLMGVTPTISRYFTIYMLVVILVRWCLCYGSPFSMARRWPALLGLWPLCSNGVQALLWTTEENRRSADPKNAHADFLKLH